MTPGRLPVSLPLLPLPRLSPSRYSSLKACALREVWTAARAPTLLPRSPAARAGSVVHRLIEEAGKGQLGDGERAAIERRWDELVAEAEADARASWLDKHLVPFKASVPDFEVRRLRAVQRAEEFARARKASGRGPGGRPSRRHEEWLETPDGLAGGYIDQVEESEVGPVLRDYKTGHILDTGSAEAGGSPKEEYQIQLQLYAAIFARVTGVWPVRLELVPLQGARREIAFQPDQCLALLDEALRKLAAVNAVIAAYHPVQAEAELASPSAETCRFCLYRPACNTYKAHHQFDEGVARWPDDLWGVVREKRVLGNGKVLLIAEPHNTPGQVAYIRGLNPSGERHPALANLAVGDTAAIYGLMSGGVGASYSETRWTVIYRYRMER